MWLEFAGSLLNSFPRNVSLNIPLSPTGWLSAEIALGRYKEAW